MSNVTRIRLPSDAVLDVLAQLAHAEQQAGYDFLLAVTIDKEGRCAMYSATDDAAPADVTHVLGATLTALHIEALETNGDDAE